MCQSHLEDIKTPVRSNALNMKYSLTFTLGVYNICKVTADLSDVPLTKFIKTRTGLKGQEYYVAVFDLVMTFSGGMIEWSFVFDGKSYGSVSVSYDQ